MKILSQIFERFLESSGRRVFLASLLIALTFVCVPPAQAGGVVSTCDETHLRSALAGGGIVTFTCGGTITLTATLTPTSDTTISGTGQNVTISGNHSVEVFSVPSGVKLTLNKLAIANGNSCNGCLSGGISNGGTLTVTNCLFSGNNGGDGGAIFNGNGLQLVVSNSTFSGNTTPNDGGAILNEGYLTITNSTFSGNSSSHSGGAITNGGPNMLVVNSTFSANSAAFGGGIFADTATAVTNSTFSGNSASGIYNGYKGGGISVLGGATVTVTNTIIANSTQGANCWVGNGTLIDGGRNLSFPDASCPGNNQDPKLDPSGLQNNGGPTQTVALLAGSPAIDFVIDFTCPTTDQRGVLRPQGARCDTGAYEYATANSLKTTVLNQMNAFLLTLNPPDAATLEDVIVPLANSLDPNLWLGPDGNHLNASVGERVFEDEEKTVGSLSQLIVDQTQLLYISNLALADRTLATVAIADAAGGNQNKLAKATAELTNGDASATAAEYSKAIEHYENAWTLALQAKP
jgi:predicted outer membrane repeat protein